jgi:hypothetical protein
MAPGPKAKNPTIRLSQCILDAAGKDATGNITRQSKEHFMFDMKNLTLLKKLGENAPEAMKAFWVFDNEAFKARAIEALHRHVIAVAATLFNQPQKRTCPSCIKDGRALQRITYDIFRTFDLSFACGGWYKQGEQDL